MTKARLLLASALSSSLLLMALYFATLSPPLLSSCGEPAALHADEAPGAGGTSRTARSCADPTAHHAAGVLPAERAPSQTSSHRLGDA